MPFRTTKLNLPAAVNPLSRRQILLAAAVFFMLPAMAPSARDAALATVHGSLIRTVIETQHPGRLEEATNAVERAVEARFGRGLVAGRTSALIVTAEKNHSIA